MTKRLDEIRNLLYARKEVSVNGLSEYYKVSAVSIRKDLAKLEQEGVLKRVYGGGVLAESHVNTVQTPAICFDNPVLYRLAEVACTKIHDGDVIFLGSGRTCCILAKMLHKFSKLSVVTNNITALDDLLSSGARIYLIGGEVTSTDGKTLFASPEDPTNFTQNIRVNKAFTSISGIDLEKGLTVNSIISTYIYKYLPSITNEWYLMADSSKFDRLSMYSAAPLTDVNYMITDSCPVSYRTRFEECGIKLVTLDENQEI